MVMMKHIKAFIFPLVIICVVVVYIFGVPYLKEKATFTTRMDKAYSSVGKNYLVKKLPYYSRGDKELFARKAMNNSVNQTNFPHLSSKRERKSSLLKIRTATDWQLNDNALLKVSFGTRTSSNGTGAIVGHSSTPMYAQNYAVQNVNNHVSNAQKMFANSMDEDQIPMAKSFPGTFPDEPGASAPLGDMFFSLSLLLSAYLVVKKRL